LAPRQAPPDLTIPHENASDSDGAGIPGLRSGADLPLRVPAPDDAPDVHLREGPDVPLSAALLLVRLRGRRRTPPTHGADSAGRQPPNSSSSESSASALSAPAGRNFDPDFRPELTPAEMLRLGVFCGK